jgi:acyl-CoA thioesterase-2
MNPKTNEDAVANLLDLLKLKKNGHDVFTGPLNQEDWTRVFGGQVIAQSLLSACETVDGERLPHSLHAYFIRPGQPQFEIDYNVSRDRDGKSFSVRRVAASQNNGTGGDKIILNMACSFQTPEDGLNHQANMAEIAPPEELQNETFLYSQLFANHADLTKDIPERFKNYLLRPRALEFKPLNQDRYIGVKSNEPKQSFWFRLSALLNEHDAGNQILQRAILAYTTDLTLLSTCLLPHGIMFYDRRLQVASLDHALWFHDDINLNEWHLYEQESPWSGGGRGMNHGLIYNRNGKLVASVSQEALIRIRKGQENPAPSHIQSNLSSLLE